MLLSRSNRLSLLIACCVSGLYAMWSGITILGWWIDFPFVYCLVTVWQVLSRPSIWLGLPETGLMLSTSVVYFVSAFVISRVVLAFRRLLEVLESRYDDTKCAACGYSLVGLPRDTVVCPECGAPVNCR